jgi:regulatory protein
MVRVAEPPPDLDGPQADPEQVARTIVLRRLEVAPRTRDQLARTLRERGVPDEVAVRVLDRFEEVGLGDDRLFARMWVDSRQSGRGLSTRALRAELRQRGVPDELIGEAVAHVGPEEELEAARQVARRRAGSLRTLPREVQVRRLSGALARKGYGAGLTARVVREVLAEVADAPDDDVAAPALDDGDLGPGTRRAGTGDPRHPDGWDLA